MKLAAEFPTELLSRVEDAVLNASSPREQLLIDGWMVRFSPGAAKRARCINAIAPGRLSLSRRIELCEPVFEGAGLPMILRITPFSEPAGLDDALAMLNWRRFDDTRVMVLNDLTVVPSDDSEAAASEWTIEPVDHEAFAVQLGRLRPLSPAHCVAHAQRIDRCPVPYSGVVVKQQGEVVACGQVAIETDLVGLYDMCTAPALRGRGLGHFLCRHLLRQAHELGARCAYLLVDAENTVARGLYEKLGFAEAYGYHYRTSDPG